LIATGKDHLQGWKEIADYLNRDERTAKRWEKQRGLPVRRIPGEGRANVYVIVSELEGWLAGGERTSSTSAVETSFKDSTNSDAELTEVILKRDAGESADLSVMQRWFWQMLVVCGACICLVAVGIYVYRTSHVLAKSGLLFSKHSLVSKSSNADVEELYLEGVYLYEERTPASLEHARRSFEEAISKDPKYAPAYTGLANTYLLSREYSTTPSEEAYAKAREAAERAIALDPNLAEAHAALGFVDFFSLWDEAAATKEFETAIRLNPQCTIAQHWYGSMLTHEARYPEALKHLNLAQRLNPASPAILATKALALGLDGHRNEAIDMLQALTSKGFDAASPHRILAILSLVEPRDVARYLDELRRVAELRKDQEALTIIAIATEAYRRAGEQAMWAAILEQEKKLHPSPEHPTRSMAEAETALGHDDEAIRELTLLAEQRDPDMIGLAMNPLFVGLRNNPKFQEAFTAAGLPRRRIPILAAR
jgi:tetratricopeptide (TPR) repeat protein